MEFLATGDHWCPTLMSRDPCRDATTSLFNVYLPSGVGDFYFVGDNFASNLFYWDQTNVLVKTDSVVFIDKDKWGFIK